MHKPRHHLQVLSSQFSLRISFLFSYDSPETINKDKLEVLKNHLLYKVQCFARISGTDKTDNLTCEIIYDNFTCENYRFSNNHHS